MFGVNQVLLGATVLGVGNTLADFFANSSLAALGFGVMACTGSIAGQLFNFLIGFGANTLKLTLNKVDPLYLATCQLPASGLHQRWFFKDLYMDDHWLHFRIPIVPGIILLHERVLKYKPATTSPSRSSRLA